MSQMMMPDEYAPEFMPDNGELIGFQEQDALRSALEQNDSEQLIAQAMSIVGAGDDTDYNALPSYLDDKLLELIDAVPLDGD